MYRKILLAVDGSDHSERAATEAAKVAKISQDTVVTLLYVIDYSKSRSDVMHVQSNEEMHLERRKLLADVEKLLNREGIEYEVKFLHGEPGPTIVEHANREKYDIVVIGSRGLNTLQEMVLGSVSHKVAKRVHAPVLIVK
ncbi:universal stress protein [Chungangia koreensis]|uniref:Universal stress protein n=1 Tax=Chungangia koreensis TaxID=752657 RepID=A0ABV8X535_9LACT